MKWKELERFNYEGYEYHIAHQIFEYSDIKISAPDISVTTKSSKKKRGKFSMKAEGHFALTNLEKPIHLFRKIFRIFNKELKGFNYVCFMPHEDKSDKRSKVYGKALNQMGFKNLWNDDFYHFMVRDGYEMKKKDLNHILWMIYEEIR